MVVLVWKAAIDRPRRPGPGKRDGSGAAGSTLSSPARDLQVEIGINREGFLPGRLGPGLRDPSRWRARDCLTINMLRAKSSRPWAPAMRSNEQWLGRGQGGFDVIRARRCVATPLLPVAGPCATGSAPLGKIGLQGDEPGWTAHRSWPPGSMRRRTIRWPLRAQAGQERGGPSSGLPAGFAGDTVPPARPPVRPRQGEYRGPRLRLARLSRKQR